jgi:hypothetical protein
MSSTGKSINFGEIDHFLYVRISSVCADLGFTNKDFIEEACELFFSLVDERCVSRFDILQEEYQKYKEFREKSRYLPRMNEKKHAFVVGIHDEIYEYLDCVRHERGFSWKVFLSIFLMLVELKMNKYDEKAWKEWLEQKDKKMVEEVFSDIRLDLDQGGFQFDKTKKRRKYEAEKAIYQERAGFRRLD